MGLDITLGVIVLLAAIRGWFKGFLLQAIQIGALVGCVYLAAPLRDLARPYALDYFPGVKPELLEKLLWWTGAVVAYLVTAGFAISTVKLYRRRHYLEGAEPNRGDQGAGFLLGAAKGSLVAIFLTAGIARYVPTYVKADGWIPEQIATSRALKLSATYHPAEQVWTSRPVQELVARVRRGGLWSEADRPAEATARTSEIPAPIVDQNPLPGAIPPPSLMIPGRPIDPRSPTFLDDFDAALSTELGERKTR
jgi:uncharacterized membrane protein required for colicin V production